MPTLSESLRQYVDHPHVQPQIQRDVRLAADLIEARPDLDEDVDRATLLRERDFWRRQYESLNADRRYEIAKLALGPILSDPNIAVEKGVQLAIDAADTMLERLVR